MISSSEPSKFNLYLRMQLMTNNFLLHVKLYTFFPLSPLSHKPFPNYGSMYVSCNNHARHTLYSLIAILATRLPRSQQFSYQEDTGLLPTGGSR